ncbi:nitronate monooxygenase [Nocardia sp. NPDC050712]|uniref:NAD(P)H-dependent flavin oxidoreductase n=1 Tax=Nocardia sp. NPDC050712 TaxID=3155518 RepID=UPI003403FB57
MALSTAFTELFGVRHPIALAPMGGSAGGALAAAVSNGGGLGLLGAGARGLDWVGRELPLLAAGTDRPWGVGFQSWAVELATVEWVLERGPAAVLLAFGDGRPFAEAIREAGVRLIVQVTDLDELAQALALEPDLIVAQGTEAGGHGALHGRSLMTFLPVAVDAAAPIPVLAAGGIADGRGLAAALALGAAGALLGTRFQATAESLAEPMVKEAIVRGRGEQTERNRIIDIASGSRWPDRYSARTLGHPYLDRWRGREAELAADAGAVQEYVAGVASGELPSPVWAGESVDLIADLPGAQGLVGRITAEAERALGGAGRR